MAASSEETEIEEKRVEDRKDVKKDDAEKKDDMESDSSLDESLFSQESLYKHDDTAMKKAISEMSEADLQRNETFRRSKFPKAGIKKLISMIIGQAVNPNIVIAVAGLSKVFIGEMIEEAKKAQKEFGNDGALLPSHIHEAYRRLCKKLPNMKRNRTAPWM